MRGIPYHQPPSHPQLPHTPSQAPFATPFALSLSKGPLPPGTP